MIDVPRETRARLHHLKTLILAEANRQNLISPTTIGDFDTRHIDDSLQLADHLVSGPILDIGSGAGLPGLVLACVRSDPIHLVEPRRMRAGFLKDAASQLSLAHVEVHNAKVETIKLPPMAAITARAVAKLGEIFAMAEHLSTEKTLWVLPKGRTAAVELEGARNTWQGQFRLVPSMTDHEAAIVVATHVARRRAK